MELIYGGPYKSAPLRPGVSQADAEGIARAGRLLDGREWNEFPR